MRSVGKQQREIAFDARKPWKRFIASCFLRRMHRGVDRIEAQLRKENVLPQFQLFRDTPRELPRNAKGREIPSFARNGSVEAEGTAACCVQPVRSTIFPAETSAECA